MHFLFEQIISNSVGVLCLMLKMLTCLILTCSTERILADFSYVAREAYGVEINSVAISLMLSLKNA